MKACAYCGRENPDDAANCRECGTSEFKNPPAALPQEGPAPGGTEDTSTPEVNMEADGTSEGDGEFRNIGDYDPFEARRMLHRFENEGLRFQIEAADRMVPGVSRGPRKISLIRIFVHRDDTEKAAKILMEDCQV
jgi:hypothetical protein